MKIAILWTKLSGYLNSCLIQLASRKDVDLFVSHQVSSNDAPFDKEQFAWMTNRLIWRSEKELLNLDRRIDSFAPDILIFVSWHLAPYRQIARSLTDRAWRVLAMDNCWNGTWKQYLGALTAPIYVRPLADAVFLPGERQAVFARNLGFKQSQIMRGLYACSREQFEAVHLERISHGRPVPRAFIFVGRFIAEKGIDVLVEAYRKYRTVSRSPWPLICCGNGPMRPMLEDQPGIRIEGFVQPNRLPDLMGSAACLVLPSKVEPWAVVVHEAASAGLALLVSENVGSAVHLVQPGHNGFIFDADDPHGLTSAMMRVSEMSDDRIEQLSRASNVMSAQFSPARWTDTILDTYYARLSPSTLSE